MIDQSHRLVGGHYLACQQVIQKYMGSTNVDNKSLVKYAVCNSAQSQNGTRVTRSLVTSSSMTCSINDTIHSIRCSLLAAAKVAPLSISAATFSSASSINASCSETCDSSIFGIDTTPLRSPTMQSPGPITACTRSTCSVTLGRSPRGFVNDRLSSA